MTGRTVDEMEILRMVDNDVRLYGVHRGEDYSITPATLGYYVLSLYKPQDPGKIDDKAWNGTNWTSALEGISQKSIQGLLKSIGFAGPSAHLFAQSPLGATPALSISGWPLGDVLRTLSIRISDRFNDTTDFKGTSSYDFYGEQLRLRANAGSTESGGRLFFGDHELCWIGEPVDDNLHLYGHASIQNMSSRHTWGTAEESGSGQYTENMSLTSHGFRLMLGQRVREFETELSARGDRVPTSYAVTNTVAPIKEAAESAESKALQALAEVSIADNKAEQALQRLSTMPAAYQQGEFTSSHLELGVQSETGHYYLTVANEVGPFPRVIIADETGTPRDSDAVEYKPDNMIRIDLTSCQPSINGTWTYTLR